MASPPSLSLSAEPANTHPAKSISKNNSPHMPSLGSFKTHTMAKAVPHCHRSPPGGRRAQSGGLVLLLNHDSGQFMTPDKSQHSRSISEPPGKGLSSRPMGTRATSRLRCVSGTLVAPLRKLAGHCTQVSGSCLQEREGCGGQPRRADRLPPTPTPGNSCSTRERHSGHIQLKSSHTIWVGATKPGGSAWPRL